MVGNEVLAIYATTEPLEGVVVGVRHLHVVDLGAITHRTKCEAVNLLVLLEGIAGKLDAHVAQYSRIVGIVIAAVLGARTTLNLLLLLVVLSFTAENDASPVTGFAATCCLLRGEYDRF